MMNFSIVETVIFNLELCIVYYYILRLFWDTDSTRNIQDSMLIGGMGGY